MKNTKKGFTIVELSIAMGFVSFLLLSIVMITISMTGIYQRGLTLRYMDQKGRELTDLIIKDIRSSRNSSAVNGATGDGWGVFCTSVSRYIWLTKRNGINGEMNWAYDTNGDVLEQQFRLVRTSSINHATDSPLCGFNVENYFSISTGPQIRISTADITAIKNGVELLPEGTNAELVVESIQRIGNNTGDGEQSCPFGEIWNSDESRCESITEDVTGGSARVRSNYVSMIIVLSTLRGNTSTNLDDGGKCRVEPNNRNFRYCALNKFEFSTRIGSSQ